ncbi:MAG: PD40 domain-containing protein [Bacteroidetes bacterium]|nr:PD40 domain-containing protein [Bacteroidota bacterium]
MKNILLSVLIIHCTGQFSIAQTAIKAKIADRLFSQYSYADAIPYFMDLNSKDETNVLYLSRLADCYRLTGNTGMAEFCYSKLIALDSIDPVYYYYYAQMLEENEKYSDARKYFILFNEKKNSDSRGRRKTSAQQDFWKDSSSYRVTNCPFNSAEADFGLFPYAENAFMFTSNRYNEISVKHTYVWNNQPFLDLYAVNKMRNDSFLTPEIMSKDVNSKYHEGPVFYEKNSNTFYLTRNNYHNGKFGKSSEGINKLKLYRAKNSGSGWSGLEEFEFNDNEYSVGHATVTPDGGQLYFSSDMPGGYGLTDIYVSTLENGRWGKPVNLGPVINSEGNEMFPFVSDDGKLYFSSDGNHGLGGLDIYIADISGGKAGEVKNPGYPLNSSRDDFSIYIFPDGKSGYFSSNRPGGKGDDDIYAFTILKKQYFVSGKALDKETGIFLPGTKITLTDETKNALQEITSDEDGFFRFEIEPGKKYLLNGKKENYFDGIKHFSSETEPAEAEIKADIVLEKDPGLSLYGLITDRVSKTPLQDVTVVIIDNFTNNEVLSMKTPVAGDIRQPLTGKKVHDRLSYQIKIEKEGYLGKTITYNAEITEPGEIKLHEALDIAMDKIEIGTDIGKIIDIKPIYFDLAKWNIRKDATAELDKIVKVMNENPNMEIELGSHTDCRSSAASNMSLSGKRAKASAEYIQKKITNPSRIYGKGYGESQPVNKCECEGDKKVPCTEEEHQMNRRTEFKVVKM